LDDICIFTRNEDDHISCIALVLDRLRAWQLYVKPSKCEWMQPVVEFVGHTISPEGRSVNDAKASSLLNWRRPRVYQLCANCLVSLGSGVNIFRTMRKLLLR
jgi:hypothetical protein